MKRKGTIFAMLYLIAIGAKAQIYGGDAAMKMPTMELYNPQMMEMSLKAHAEMAARKSAIFHENAELAVDAYNHKGWSYAIRFADTALSLYDNASLRYIRGSAYEKLGIYKAALKDYKAAKKGGIVEAISAYDALKKKIKEQKKKK